jgi:predicted transcriptional regulator
MRGTSVKLPDDVFALMERAAREVGQSPSQYIREAVLLRVAVGGGEVSEELRALAVTLRTAEQI